MNLLDSLIVALQSLKANLMRSLLTALGIIIGVAAVIAMIAVGAGAERNMEQVMNTLGSNLIYLQPVGRSSGRVQLGADSGPSLTEADAVAVAEEIQSVHLTAPYVSGSGQVIAGNQNWFTAFRGVTENYFPALDWDLEHGRFIEANDERSARKVAVLGQSVVEKLFEGNNPVGAVIRIQRVPFEVVGTVAAKGQTPWGRDQDDVIMVPLSTAKKRLLGQRQLGQYVDSIAVKVADVDSFENTERQINELLRIRHEILPGQPDDYRIRNMAQALAARADSTRVMKLLLASVASVSLLVGGIGIMNIMLVSVTERTREIGLRMATGATGGAVLVQFVIESGLIALAGGLVGVSLGIAGTYAVAEVAEWPVVLEPLTIVFAALFAATIGIFFGYYPARKASRLDPIEALRHE